ncbi:hypothetical protein DD238_005233 [Peronospora effusa]|nr:hypothetical protein DD238_005233 [Peronospora effusa]
MESHREAQSTEAASLQERIQSLESELQELRSQRESDTLSAEETIRSLKESESQTAETLEAIRQELAETEVRAVSAEGEHNLLRVAFEQKEALSVILNEDKTALVERVQAYEARIGELDAVLEVRALELSSGTQQIDLLESQLAQTETQLRDLLNEIKVLKEVIASLSEASSSAADEVNSLHKQRASEEENYAAGIARKDEVILKLKSKLEEVVAAYKRLKGHLQEQQDRLAQQVTTSDYLKTSYDELNAQYSASTMELDALKLELASSRKQSAAMAEEMRLSGEKVAESEAHHKTQIENFKKRVLAYEDEFAQMRSQHDVVLQEQKEKLLTASAARDETAQLKIAELEKLLAVLTETVEQKELEIQSMAERIRHIEEKHAQAGSAREETARKHEAEQMELEAQLSSANETIEKLRIATDANVGLQHKTTLQLKKQITQLQVEVKVETEGANAARVALETYKKRAYTALKKASRENKLNLKKAAESTTKLENEILSAKVRISVLKTELEETRRRMEEVESAGDALAQSKCNALEADKRSQEAALRLEIESLNAEVIWLKEAMDSEKVSLESQNKQLAERNEALNHEISLLNERARTENEAVEQAVQAKEEEINNLSKQLHAALAAAASLATNEAERRSYTPSSSPTEKERRSTASSSRSFDSEGNNSYVHQTTLEEQHEHITAAVGNSCPIPLASKIIVTKGVEQQSKALVNSDDEVVRLTLLLNEVQSKFHVFQKKYEDASALLEEANRQKQHLERSTQELNIEYLKNVVIKYIESQVPREKEQLVPVIAALLSFTPQEHRQVMAAHSKASDEGAGLFGGVFSLFGGGATTTSSPTVVAAPHTIKPSPTTARGNTTGAALGSKGRNGILSFGSDSSDDEEFERPLNPFAS